MTTHTKVQNTNSGAALMRIGKLVQPTPRLTISFPLLGISNSP
jgi:hypothetical protein